jgi:hypothetical protein
MKRVDYVFIFPTNLPKEDPSLFWKLQAGLQNNLNVDGYKRPEVDMEVEKNGMVNISIDTTQIEISDYGDFRLYGYLICNDDVEQTGISNEVYDWFEKTIREIVEYILSKKITIIPPTLSNEKNFRFKIYLDDLNRDKLEQDIDDIDDYEE